MDTSYFAALEGLSPWWWVALGIGLGAVEMATMSFFLIWPGLAAIIMAIVLALFPGMPGEVQVAAFSALAVAMTFGGRGLMGRFGDGAAETNLNSRASALIGRRGTVVTFADGEGTVEVDGIRWKARADANLRLPAGTRVSISEADAMTLTVVRDDSGDTVS